MKALFSSVFMMFPFFFLSGSDKAIQSTWLKPGTELIYNVLAFGDEYDFVVNLSEVGDQVSFDYYMTNDNNVAGSIIIPASDMANATSHMNYFSGGEKTLNGQTTVFFSRKAFEDIVAGKSVTIDVGMGSKVSVRKQTPEERDAMNEELLDLDAIGEGYMPYGGIYFIDREDISYQFFEDHIVLVDENGKHTYSVLNNPEFPLITFMDLGWTIELVDVNTP